MNERGEAALPPLPFFFLAECEQMKTIYAANLILRYYRAFDAFTETPGYHSFLDIATESVVEKFINTTEAEAIPLVKLFFVLIGLQTSIQTLDSLGGEESAQALQDVYRRVDANMRQIVSRLTNEDVRNDADFDQDFVERMAANSNDVISLDSYRPRKKLKSQG